MLVYFYIIQSGIEKKNILLRKIKEDYTTYYNVLYIARYYIIYCRIAFIKGLGVMGNN